MIRRCPVCRGVVGLWLKCPYNPHSGPYPIGCGGLRFHHQRLSLVAIGIATLIILAGISLRFVP